MSVCLVFKNTVFSLQTDNGALLFIVHNTQTGVKLSLSQSDAT